MHHGILVYWVCPHSFGGGQFLLLLVHSISIPRGGMLSPWGILHIAVLSHIVISAFDLLSFSLKEGKSLVFIGFNCFLRNAFMMIGQLWEKKTPENLCLGKRQGNIRKQSVGLQEHCSYPLEQFL